MQNWDMDHLKEKVEDFVSKHSKKLVEVSCVAT